MAASPSPSRRSPASSSASLKHSDDAPAATAPISVDTLVNHLLVAKRSLSSMTLVLRANELATAARSAHEESVILDAQTGFLRGAIIDQIAVLVRVRRSLHATYEWVRKDFKKLIRAMDEADGELGATMEMLRGTDVQDEFRPSAGERRNLLDFVDESSVHAMREAMKKSIEELQGIQQSFDGDLLRFETEIRSLKKIVSESLPPPPPSSDDDGVRRAPPAMELLLSMDDDAAAMAQLLASLTKHFDMCVTAVRTTEGAAALARRRAAEATQSQGSDAVSISGVIAEQESHMTDLEPETAEDRAEMLKVVTQDADEVDGVVREIHARLAATERHYAALEQQARDAHAACAATAAAYAALGHVGDRLADYLAAEDDVRERWDAERDVVLGRLREMREMRHFYDGYASAYASLVLEVERRRAVDRQVDACWRKAREAVDRLLDADRAARDAFRHEVGEFLPTDLWAGVETPVTTFRVVPVLPPAEGGSAAAAEADAEAEADADADADADAVAVGAGSSTDATDKARRRG